MTLLRAPLFHYLFPTRQFDANKCSHTAATTILSYIRLAYPGFKDPLQELLENPTTTIKQRTILQNLQHLCEYFIPVVCIFFLFCDVHILNPQLYDLFLLFAATSLISLSIHRSKTTTSACVSTICPSLCRCYTDFM